MAKDKSDGVFWSVFKFAVTVFALILILIGIIVAPSPVPFGFIFIVLGFLLLSAAAPDLIRWWRRRWRWLDRRLIALEKRLPKWLARQLRRSGVDEDDDDDPQTGSSEAPRAKAREL